MSQALNNQTGREGGSAKGKDGNWSQKYSLQFFEGRDGAKVHSSMGGRQNTRREIERKKEKLRKVSFPSEQKVDDFFIPICDSLVMTESPVGIQQGHRPASTH